MFSLGECGFPNVEMDLPLNVPLSTPHFRSPEWSGPCGTLTRTRSKKSKKHHKKHSKKEKKHHKHSEDCGCSTGSSSTATKTKTHSKKGKKHSKKCCKPGCPGKPGPVAQIVSFGAVRPVVNDAPVEPFMLLLNGNGVVSPGLDAASALTAPYAYMAVETTTKVNVSASIDAPAGTIVDLTLHVAEPALPPVNTTSRTVSVTAPFTLLTNIDFGVAQGWIVWLEVATSGGVANPDFAGLTVDLELYQPRT